MAAPPDLGVCRAGAGNEDALTRRHDRTLPLDTTIRLRIATRIHFALLRQYGEDVAVGTLLKDGAAAREALWVCEASPNHELVALARKFDIATRQEARATQLRSEQAAASEPGAPQGAHPQELSWAQDTSGFGISRLQEAGEPSAPQAHGWLKPSRWLRRSTTRGAR
jgi:hypothetical protein